MATRDNALVLRSRVKGNDDGQWRGKSRSSDTPISENGGVPGSSSGSSGTTPINVSDAGSSFPAATCVGRDQLRLGDGTIVSCGLYACVATTPAVCLTTCGSIADCTGGAICNPAGACVAPPPIAADAGPP